MPVLRVVLIATYELGRQPFGLASPAAWLAAAGAEVTCLDLAVSELHEQALAAADLVCFHIPMHTATRLAVALVPRIRTLAPHAHLCFYGLYAPLNAAYLRELGAETILGGEFEEGLVALATGLAEAAGAAREALPVVSLGRQRFRLPLRTLLPGPGHYARLTIGPGPDDERTTGYTEATRGCLHLCRHCPIPPVYHGTLRVVDGDIVLADIAQQVEAGAQHITFGDPDFFNGPGHALRIVRALHERFPSVTYDVTIKVEHLLRHAGLLAELRRTGCLFVTSAIEAVDDAILDRFAKGHTRADVITALALCRAAGLTVNPTFVAFTPWTSRATYHDFLSFIAEHGLIESVSPVQYGIRLLIPAGSLLLDLSEMQDRVEPFDKAALVYRWIHPDPAMDELCTAVLAEVRSGQAAGAPRRAIFERVWRLTSVAPLPWEAGVVSPETAGRPPFPYLSEPWYC